MAPKSAVFGRKPLRYGYETGSAPLTGILPERIPRGRRVMGRFGAAWAKAHLRELGDVAIPAGFAGSRARTN